jgi:hypothetical protein
MPPEPTIKALAAQVSHLRGQVANLTRAFAELTYEGPGMKAYAPNWIGLTPAQRAKKLAPLVDWVGTVLTVQYLRKPLRECWPQHQPVVNELSTLRAEWFRIYNRKYPDLPSALAFLNRYLPDAVARSELALTDCQVACALASAPTPIRPRPARPRPA